MQKPPPIEIDKLLAGDRRTLAQAITLIESSRLDHQKQAQDLLSAIIPYTGKSLRIGISGIPGVGKSTFIEALGLYLTRELKKKIAVLAIDPSSPLTGGSILGDKTRMEELLGEENAFIRPSPTSGALGGVSYKTRESLLLCEAAGVDIVLVETVGVGQSEVDVSSMVDFYLVLMIPNAGDELQGIKKGIIELADALIINEDDGESTSLAQSTKSHYQTALHLLGHKDMWEPKVMTCSAIEKKGINKIWEMILSYFTKAQENGSLKEKRSDQNKTWMWKIIHHLFEQDLNSNTSNRQKFEKIESDISQGRLNPIDGAKKIYQEILKS